MEKTQSTPSRAPGAALPRKARHITPDHVAELDRLARHQQCKGLFIHTGKTGKKSRDIANNAPNIGIISGQRLLRLLTPGEDASRKQEG